MPFPPPPPPPGPPPPPSFPSGGTAANPNERNQLLQSIRKGTTLKKAVTNDRSAPSLGKTSDGVDSMRGGSNSSVNSNNNSNVINSQISNNKRFGANGGGAGNGGSRNLMSGSATLGRNSGLAGLFAGGMPKLKSTGIDIGQSQSNSGSLQSLNSLPLVGNASSLHSSLNKHETLRKQFSIEANKSRGPPPQPPPANQKPQMPQSASDSILTGGPMHSRSNSTTSLNTNGWMNNINNNAAIHNNNNNNNNNPIGINRTVNKAPPGGYGKPNVAPKPPGINVGVVSQQKPSPPPKKVAVNGSRTTVTRAQSMKAPKSPPIASPITGMVFGPVSGQTELVSGRMGAAPTFYQSQDSLLQNTPPSPRSVIGGSGSTLSMPPRSGAASPSRPRLRPPLTRPPPPPPSRMASPPCPPPPPPNVTPPPPNMAPPPPPHRAAPPPAISRAGGPTNTAPMNSIAPPPPIRHSSMRNGMTQFSGSLESRFIELFRQVEDFPPPQPFLGKTKIYNSKTAKQHAPPPPPGHPGAATTHVQLGSKMWSRDNTSTC